jgi:hypothetical protein
VYKTTAAQPPELRIPKDGNNGGANWIPDVGWNFTPTTNPNDCAWSNITHVIVDGDINELRVR